MAQATQLKHRYITATDLPYVSNDSPTSKDPVWQSGSSNILTSYKGYAERRPGFNYYEADTGFTFSGTVQRFFAWRRWTNASVTLSGEFFVMYSDTSATASRVYKQRVGTDVYPVLLHTDSTSNLPFDFEVSNNFVFFCNGTDRQKWDGTTKTNWGITGPSNPVTLTVTGGSLSAVIGYQYVVAWENSSTTHMSSPSPQSASTGFQSAAAVTITGNTTTDTQVDRVRVGRTIDGGSIYFEHPNSPIAYATWTGSGFTDSSTSDTALTASGTVMPLPNQNNRPTASLDPVWFAGRIWTHSGDTLYYSDFEELVRGVEEESFATVNQRQLGREIIKKAVVGQYLLVWCADIIFRIYGDSLATFKLDVLARQRGCLGAQNVVSLTGTGLSHDLADRGLAAWLDTSSTVWTTNGESIKELSYDIRPDIATINHSQAAIAQHSTGNTHWLILMDGANGKLYVMDLDSGKWMPPWSITGVTAIRSLQTAVGTWQLFLAKSGKPLVAYSGYQDAGTNFAASGVTNLFDIVPSDNPSNLGVVDHVEVETASVTLTSLKYVTDEDPAGATFTTFQGTGITPPRRVQGTNLVETWYHSRTPAARRVALQFNWVEANSNFKLYSFACAYEVIDG